MMDNSMEIEFLDTPEEFRSTAEVILTQLFELLKALSALEREVYERNEKLNEEKLQAGIPHNQMAPGSKELWDEYYERYEELVTSQCTEKLLRRGYAGSFGKPGKYDYVNTACKVVCTMKNAKKATIQTFFHKGVDMKHQFLIKNVDGEWEIDEVKYGFPDEPQWYADRI